jgi:hypothetical protein
VEMRFAFWFSNQINFAIATRSRLMARMTFGLTRTLSKGYAHFHPTHLEALRFFSMTLRKSCSACRSMLSASGRSSAASACCA